MPITIAGMPWQCKRCKADIQPGDVCFKLADFTNTDERVCADCHNTLIHQDLSEQASAMHKERLGHA